MFQIRNSCCSKVIENSTHRKREGSLSPILFLASCEEYLVEIVHLQKTAGWINETAVMNFRYNWVTGGNDLTGEE